LDAYSHLLWSHCSCAVRNYRAFLLPSQLIDFDQLATTMSAITRDWYPFARFYPFDQLSADELKTYFTSDRAVRDCRCDILDERLAIDASGRLVTCPDFPDLSYGTLAAGVTNSAPLSWLRKRFAENTPLPTCARCCHYVPKAIDGRPIQ
jgi:hypothetical protein